MSIIANLREDIAWNWTFCFLFTIETHSRSKCSNCKHSYGLSEHNLAGSRYL